MMLWGLLAAGAVAVLDVGAEPIAPPTRAAIERALAGLLPEEAALRDALVGVAPSSSANRAQGSAALGRAKVAFGALRCEEARRELDSAERDLGGLPVADVRADLAEIYRYRAACAAQANEDANSVELAAIAQALGGQPPARKAETARLSVSPEDAQIFIDGALATERPIAVSAGTHVLDVERTGYQKVHRTIVTDSRAPEYVIGLAPLGADPLADLRAQAQSLRGHVAESSVAVLARLAARARADRLLLVDTTGGAIQARLFDAEAGALAGPAWTGHVVAGGVPGLRAFATGGAGTTPPAARPGGLGERSHRGPSDSDRMFSHWYSWVILGALGALAAALAIAATRSNEDLTVRSSR
jgi:hypothetical protein